MPLFQNQVKQCNNIALPATNKQAYNVVRSLKNGDEWVWIKIPKTATISYRTLFFPELPSRTNQVHVPWHQIPEFKTTPGFTVVRNPISRFKSVVGHLMNNTRTHFNFEFTDTDDLVSFFEQHEEYLTNNAETLSETWVKETFQLSALTCNTCNMSYPGFFKAMFSSQVFWAYHPNMKVFKYEDLSSFNNFIVNVLGYDATQIVHANKTEQDKISHIDFTDSRIVSFVKRLYTVDYEAFGYEQ